MVQSTCKMRASARYRRQLLWVPNSFACPPQHFTCIFPICSTCLPNTVSKSLTLPYPYEILIQSLTPLYSFDQKVHSSQHCYLLKITKHSYIVIFMIQLLNSLIYCYLWNISYTYILLSSEDRNIYPYCYLQKIAYTSKLLPSGSSTLLWMLLWHSSQHCYLLKIAIYFHIATFRW